MNGVDPIIWSALLMLLGCGLVILEVFIPSGGILGFLAIASIFSAVGLAFYQYGLSVGLTFLIVALVAIPATLMLAFKYWPMTPMGRRFLLGLPTREEVSPEDERQRALKGLVGKVGVTKCDMLPSGAISLDGQTVDAISRGMPIEAGQRVVVVEVKANRVVVRPARKEERRGSGDDDDLLSQSLDGLGIDGLDEPLS
ncbi:MAG: NfeD family protein [Pirellulales bacterium]